MGGRLRCWCIGGAGRIGKSCFYIGDDDRGVLIDAGLSVKNGDPMVSVPDDLRGKVKAIIITHAHLDHVGSLPWVWHRLGRPPIYMTPLTYRLATVILQDAQKVSYIKNKDFLVAPSIFDDCLKACERGTLAMGGEGLVDEKIRFRFHKAGHVPGAAYVELFFDGQTVVYSGDIADFKQRVVDACDLPPERQRCDMLILESTYGGDMRVWRRSEEIKHFVAAVDEVLRRRGKVLIPAFAVGRAQEVILILLSRMLSRGMTKAPIYVDGLARDVCYILEEEGIDGKDANVWKAERKIFFRHGIVEAVESQERRDEIVNSYEPCVIVSTSGMLTAGPAAFYAKHILPDSDSAVLLVGYQDEESVGYALLSRGETVKIDGTDIPVRCTVEQYRLSAHAHAGGLQRFAYMWNPKTVVLVHPGDRKGRKELAGFIYRTLDVAPVCPDDGDVVYVGDMGEHALELEEVREVDVTGSITSQGLVLFLPGDALNYLKRKVADEKGYITLAGDNLPFKLNVKFQVDKPAYEREKKKEEEEWNRMAEEFAKSPVVHTERSGRKTRKKAEKRSDRKSKGEKQQPLFDDLESKIREILSLRLPVTDDNKPLKILPPEKALLGGKVDPEIAEKIPTPILRRIFRLDPDSPAYEYVVGMIQVLLLKRLGLTGADIARRLGLPGTTVRDRLKSLELKGVKDPEVLMTDNLLELFPYLNATNLANQITKKVKLLKREYGIELFWQADKHILALPENAHRLLELWEQHIEQLRRMRIPKSMLPRAVRKLLAET